MADEPDFLSGIIKALPGARVSSGARTQQQQDALWQAGKTRAHGPNAPHVRTIDGNPGAVDIVNYDGSPEALSTALTQAGYTVARVRPETGQGQNQGTGAHMHVEFGKGKQVATQTAPSVDPAAPTANPTSAFANEKQINDLSTQVQGEGQATQNVFSQARQHIDEIQAQREADLTQTVALKEAAATDIENQTRELQQRTLPLFARREAIAHRRTELATMNPFKKAILGAFNPNYNEGRLNELDQATANELSVAGEEYKTTTALQNTLIDAINMKYQGREAISTLDLTNTNQDLDLQLQGWNLKRQQLNDALAGVSAGAELTRAQMLARSDALSQMDMGAINSGLAQARRSKDGTATINGVPISIAELNERSKQLQQQDMALKAQRLALQSQELGLAKQHEDQLISHMSSADIQAAIKADGVFRGVKLDQGMLTQAYQNSLQRTQLMAGDTLQNVSGQSYTAYVDAMNGSIQDTNRRIAGITGSKIPPGQQQFLGQLIATGRQYGEAIRAAPNEQTRQALRAQFLPKMQELYAQQGKILDGVVASMTRDKDAQVVLKGYMTGVVPTGEQAVRGLIALSQGGALPPGVKPSGPAAAAINAAKSALDGFYKANGGQASVQAILQGGNKESKAQLQYRMNQAVTQAVSAKWNAGNMSAFMTAIPQMAASEGHAAGRIRPQDFASAQAAGDAQGYSSIAQKLGISAEQAQQIFSPTGSKKDGFDKLVKGKGSYEDANRFLQQVQTMGFLRALDTGPSAAHDFKPSAALVEFMRSPGFQNRVNAFNRNIGHTGFGEMLADSISGGSLGEVASKYANALSQAQGAYEFENQASIRKQADLYRGSPLKRASVIMGAIPGLDQHSEQMLLDAIHKQIGASPNGSSMQRGAAEFQNETIDSIIMTGKFQDPKLEKARQIAAKDWQTFSKSTDTAMDRLWSNVAGMFK